MRILAILNVDIDMYIYMYKVHFPMNYACIHQYIF